MARPGSLFACLLVLVAALLAGAPRPASAKPTFDCSKGFKPIERLICGDEELWPVENETFAAWRWLRRSLGPAAQKALMANQRIWIKAYPERCGLRAHGKLSRQQAAASKDCVMQSLRARTAELRAFGAANFAAIDDQPARAKELERILEELAAADARDAASQASAEELAAYTGEAVAGPAAYAAPADIDLSGYCSCAETLCAQFGPAQTTMTGIIGRRGDAAGEGLVLSLDQPLCVLGDFRNAPRGPRSVLAVVGDPALLEPLAGQPVVIDGALMNFGPGGVTLVAREASPAPIGED